MYGHVYKSHLVQTKSLLYYGPDQSWFCKWYPKVGPHLSLDQSGACSCVRTMVRQNLVWYHKRSLLIGPDQMLGTCTHLYAICLSHVNYAPVICNHLPPPTYGDGRGVTGLMCGVVTFWVPPQCRVNAGLVILHKYTPMEFTILQSRAFDSQQVPAVQGF